MKHEKINNEKDTQSLNKPQVEAKRKYSKPKLKNHGTLVELTQGPTTGFQDGFGSGTS